ncbi:MAG: hypothetical protein FJ279_37675, partial [Planctomycetes bacterium]|nr:hypothetical protein [Planctomycetota bacterium]
PATFTKPYEADEKFLRQVDGLVQLCQAHRLVYLPCLLCGYNTVASDEELAKQAAYSEAFAKRYAKVPGIAYYVNGDLSFRWIDSPDIKRLWNEFLKQRYGTDERLREAWRLNPPEAKLGDLPVAEPRPKGWADIRACDFHEFKIRLVERWIDAQHRACRRGDPEHPTTVEYYQLPYGGIDMRRSMAGLDLGNIGYFGLRGKDIADYPRILKFNDLRVVGKGVSVGEFGVKTHPAWSPEEGYPAKTYHTTRTEAEQLDLFLAIPHYTLGLGGAKMHNWCWLDADEWVFPWGLCYPCDNVEKDALCIYRNVGLLFRLFEPVYVPPSVYLLMPDTHRLGPSAPAVQAAVLKAIDALLDLHVDFAPIGEAELDRLPKQAQAILYPIPFCLSDATYEHLKRFVTNGGALYISGDFSFDPLRERTRTARLRELAGVEFEEENYPGITSDATHEVQATAEGEDVPSYTARPCMRFRLVGAQAAISYGGLPLAVFQRLGKGLVFFTADAPELWQSEDSEVLRDLYKFLIRWTGVQHRWDAPDDPAI